MTTQKNPAAVELGRLGGLKGGKARAEKLTQEQRNEIATKAASVRWKKPRYNTCRVCKFWSNDHECHRHSPTALFIPVYEYGELVRHELTGRFPITEPDDWCGEYKP